MLCVKNGMIHNAVTREPFRGDILVENGKIRAVGEHLEIPEGTEIVDADCRYIRALWRPTDISDWMAMASAMREWTTMR